MKAVRITMLAMALSASIGVWQQGLNAPAPGLPPPPTMPQIAENAT